MPSDQSKPKKKLMVLHRRGLIVYPPLFVKMREAYHIYQARAVMNMIEKARALLKYPEILEEVQKDADVRKRTMQGLAKCVRYIESDKPEEKKDENPQCKIRVR